MRYVGSIAILLCALLPGMAHAQTVGPFPGATVSMFYSYSEPVASVGDPVTIVVNTAGVPAASIVVTVNGTGIVMDDTSGGSGTSFSGFYTVTETDPETAVEFSVVLTDASDGERTFTEPTSGNVVVIDRTAPVFDAFMHATVTAEIATTSGYAYNLVLPTATDNLGTATTTITTCYPMPPFPVGTTDVYCYAYDHAQNQSEQVLFLTAIITDTTAPVITLTGGASVSVEQGSTFVDPGYAVTDNSDVEMTVTIEGTVDTAVLGDYVLTYATSDDFGNTASTTRTVSVIEASAPSGGGGGGGGSRRADRNEEPPVEEEEVAETEEAVEGEVLGATTYNFSRSLRQGDSGADVMELQNFLRAQGHFTHVSTGYYGPITAAALKEYQAAHGLPPVGLVGPSTLALLNQGTVTTDPHAALLLEIARLKAAIAELTAVQ